MLQYNLPDVLYGMYINYNQFPSFNSSDNINKLQVV